MTAAAPILFVRARRAHYYVPAIIAVGVAAHLAGAEAVRFHLTDTLTVPWLLFVPVVDAALIGLCAATAMHDWEALSQRSLRRDIAILLVVEIVIAGISTAYAADELHGSYSSSTAVRNLCGFTGMALVSAVILGALLAWVLPLAYAVIAIVGGGQVGQVQAWAWPAVAGGHPAATAQALAWLALGLWLACTVSFRQNVV